MTDPIRPNPEASAAGREGYEKMPMEEFSGEVVSTKRAADIDAQLVLGALLA